MEATFRENHKTTVYHNSDMEFGTHFTRTHVLGSRFYPKIQRDLQLFFVNYTIYPNKKMVFLICYPNFQLCAPFYPCFFQKNLFLSTNCDHKEQNISARSEFMTNSVCSELYFTPKMKFFTRTMSVRP